MRWAYTLYKQRVSGERSSETVYSEPSQRNIYLTVYPEALNQITTIMVRETRHRFIVIPGWGSWPLEEESDPDAENSDDSLLLDVSADSQGIIDGIDAEGERTTTSQGQEVMSVEERRLDGAMNSVHLQYEGLGTWVADRHVPVSGFGVPTPARSATVPGWGSWPMIEDSQTTAATEGASIDLNRMD